MKLGLSSYTYGWAVGVQGHEPAHRLDENGLLAHARYHGIRLLQIGDNLPLHTFDSARLDRLAKRAAENGVQLEIGARRLTIERVSEYAAIARRIGATLVRFVIDDAEFFPSVDEVVATLRMAIPFLDGITLCIENHDRFPAAVLRGMIEGAGSERIGVCLDTANSLGAGEGLATVIPILAPLVLNLHIKDFQIARVPYLMGFQITGCPAGRGMMDLPSLLHELAPFNRCKSAVLELWTPPEPQLADTISKESAWAVESLDYLRPFFSQS